MTIFRSALRHHLPFLIIMPLLIVVMTWPTMARVFDFDSFWLVQDNIDANMLFWDAWYFEQLITGQADYFFTGLLFHPQGVSLAFHNFSLPHMFVLTVLKTILPPANAFNLTYLVLVFLNAAAGYVYLNYLFRDKWIALFGSVVFGASAFIISRPATVQISFIATVPLSLYYLHRGLVEERLYLILISSALIGATAFIGLYTLVCLLIIVSFYIVVIALYRWRMAKYWLSVVLLLSVSAAIVYIRVYPMFSDPAGLSGALAKNEGFELGTDLIWYFVNYKHPILTPLFQSLFPIVDRPGWDRVVYLGYIPLALLALSLLTQKTRRQSLPWFVVALIFLVLRLGSTLTVNSTHYEHILLPKHYLTEAFPQIFKAFWTPDNFHAGTLFPFAVLACYGLVTLLQSVPGKQRLSLILLLSGLVAFEYYQVQRPFVLPEGRLDFIDWLRQEDDQDSIHLINLPLGGQHSKVYAFYQSLNGYPHVEGRPTRTPPTAFDYIESNRILKNWQGNKSVNCLPFNSDEFIAARDKLLDDGFTHIILHRDRLRGDSIAGSFVNIPAAYKDQFVTVYRLNDLHESCDMVAMLGQSALPHLQRLDQSVLVPEQGVSILSVHPFEIGVGDAARRYSAVLNSVNRYTPLSLEDIMIDGAPDHDQERDDAISALDANSIIVLVYDPQATDADTVELHRSWLASIFNSCARVADTDDTVIEYHLRHGFPCQLAAIDESLAVDYDNGMQLGNLLSTHDESFLDVYLLWKRRTTEKHSVSIQFFDGAGSKIHGQDFIIGREPLAHHRLDLSALPAGDFSAKLIVYNYDTGVSVPGVLGSSLTRFDRELEFTQLSLNSG